MTSELKHELFEDSLLYPLRGLELTVVERFVAAMLLEAKAAEPIGIKRIRRALNDMNMPRSERDIKDIIRTLRKTHRLPIISRRKDGGGFWWCENEEQMRQYFKHASHQPLDSIGTLYGMIRENYPKLAGQLDLSWCGNADEEVVSTTEGHRGQYREPVATGLTTQEDTGEWQINSR